MHTKIKNTVWKGLAILLSILVIVLSGLGIVLFNASRWVMDTWGLITFDEIIFHLKVPMEGTNTDMIFDFINQCLPAAILVMLLELAIFIAFRKRRKKYVVVCTAGIVGAVVLSVSAANYLWVNLDIGTYLETQGKDSTFIQDHYVDVKNTELIFPEQKRNLIYIFLESTEATFMGKEDGAAFDQNVIPELTEVARNNISFSNSDLLAGGAYPAFGSTWTMGGMFAQTSGLPLKIPIDGNAMSNQDLFMPAVTSIGDILAEQGYRQSLLIGSDAEFGGRKNYFEQHGNYEMLDYGWANANGKIPPDYRVWWGYEDQKLFDIAKEKLTEISMTGQPFNFTMLTVDTHFEDGYYCEKCQPVTENQYANVYLCASHQLQEFLTWIQQQSFYPNTTIVLSGDHLTMDSDFCLDIDPSYERTVYNAFINPAVMPVQTKNRQFTTMDMFPSTLASMGVTIQGERLGLGTNLFSAEPTLAEQYGIETIDEELVKESKFFDNFVSDIKVEGEE